MLGKLNKWFLLVIVVILAVASSGCYLNQELEPDQYGANVKGGEVTQCLASGVHSNMGWFDDLVRVSKSTLTMSVSDPEVATKDNQLIGASITIQVRRKSDCDSIKNLLMNWSALKDDKALIDTVSATAREALKNGVRAFTLDQLLDDRNSLAGKIVDDLSTNTVKYSTDVINVTIENIGLDPKYADVLQQKALLTAQIEQEKKRQDFILQQASNQQLEQQQKQKVAEAQLLAEQEITKVNVEIASRSGKETAAKNEIYKTNEQAYELERMRLLQTILGDKSVIYFLPQGTDLTMLYGTGGIVPYGPPSPSQ